MSHVSMQLFKVQGRVWCMNCTTHDSPVVSSSQGLYRKIESNVDQTSARLSVKLDR